VRPSQPARARFLRRSTEEAERHRILSGMKQALGWIFVALTAVFVAFNLDSARVWFFGVRAEMPIALVVIASSVLGALACYAFMSLKSRKA
jgi:uncharacterized integral membrane protein